MTLIIKSIRLTAAKAVQSLFHPKLKLRGYQASGFAYGLGESNTIYCSNGCVDKLKIQHGRKRYF